MKNNGSLVTSPDYTCFVHCPGDWSQICGGFGSANFYEACVGNNCFQNSAGIGPLATAALGAPLPTQTTSSVNAAATALAAHPSITCNWSDGRSYTQGGKTFEIKCLQNWQWQGDISHITTSNMEACLAYGAGVSGCVAVVYSPGTGYCAAKNSSVGLHNFDAAAWAGIMLDTAYTNRLLELVTTPSSKAASSTKAITAAATPTGPAINCPAANGSVIAVANSGKSYTVLCDTDHIGGDASSSSAPDMNACMAMCANHKGCLGVTFNTMNQWCWIKTMLNPSNVDSSTIAAVVLPGAPSYSSSTEASKLKTKTKTKTMTKSPRTRRAYW